MAKAMDSNKKLLRILMLHGYKQNESLFKDRTGSLRKLFKGRAELVYCEAPHEIPKTDESATSSEDSKQEVQKGWWLKSSDFNEHNLKYFQRDFEKTLQHMNQLFAEKGPFDGIFAFSQGGTLATILCKIALNQTEYNYENIRFKFVIIAANSKSPEVYLEHFYDLNNKISIPSLHVIGKTDKLVPVEDATALAEYFLNPKIFIHEQGHLIPIYQEAKMAYKEFFDQITYSNE
jgi:predicted esterase